MEHLRSALAAAQQHAAKYDDITSETKWERDSINAIVADLEAAIAEAEAGGDTPQGPPMTAPAARQVMASQIMGNIVERANFFGTGHQPRHFDLQLNRQLLGKMARVAVYCADQVAVAADAAPECDCPNCPNQPNSDT